MKETMKFVVMPEDRRPKSRKMKLNGKLELFDDGDTKYIKAFLPDAYQIQSFELYLGTVFKLDMIFPLIVV